MDSISVVLEISSDEDVGWNDHSGSGISNGGDDHNWLTELLDEVNKETKGNDDFDEVVVVSESEKPLKKLKLSLKASSVDLDDDCVILDHDPNEPLKARNDDPIKEVDDDSDDIVVVSEKGQVACRDYPHPRHLCIKFPFSTTPNQSHCEQCYCYVCDSLAPCVNWGNGIATMDHCHATDKDEIWIIERKSAKSGNKDVQPLNKDASFSSKLPQVDIHRPAPALVQSHNQFPGPGSIHATNTSANIRPPNNSNQNINHILASRKKVHPDLVSQFVLRHHQNAITANQNLNVGFQSNRPVVGVATTANQRSVGMTTSANCGSVGVATTSNRGSVGVATTANRGSVGVATAANRGSVRVATTANRYPSGSYRGNFGNHSRQQNYIVNGMPSGPNKYLASLQPNTVSTSIPNLPQSQNCTSSTVYPPPLPPQPKISNQPNTNIQSQVNTNVFTEEPHFQPDLVLTPSSQPQLASSNPSYMVPAQPSYQASSQTRVYNPSVLVSDTIQNFPQGSQAQGPITDSGFKDYRSSWPSGQDSATHEDAASTNDSSLAGVSDGLLADFQYDWILDNQPVEAGFMDFHGPNGLNDYSADSAFLDTSPIFEF